MADYNSSYTGLQIDDAVGKALAALPVDNTLSMIGKAADAKKTGEELNDLKSALQSVAIYDTASGAIAHFEDGADGMPLKKLVVNIEPAQSGSGDPSPENVRQISGWTECNIRHSGEDTTVPTVIPITFPTEAGTVYGGSLTINADGSVELDNIFTKGSIPITTYNSAGTTAHTKHVRKTLSHRATDGNTYTADIYCDQIPTIAGNSDTEHIARVGQYLHLWYPNSFATVGKYFESFATRPEIAYPLAEYETYQLTPQQVTTLLGTNNIWADCGPVSVDYHADTKLYIQKINAPTDDDMIADAQIASGKYFLIGNTLYLSTTVIPAGDTIIPGTNCTKTNLAAALNALNA